MTKWWISISGFEKMFYYFAIPFTLLFLIQLIMTFIGIGDDFEGGDVDDVGFEDISSSFHFFTIRNFITFFTVFGWTGITLINNGVSNGVTLILSTISGIIAMLIVAFIFFTMMKFTESGTLNINNAIGNTGEVYIPIPEKRSGIGKVQIIIQGSLREIEAMTNGGYIATGNMIKVISIINNVLIVEKI